MALHVRDFHDCDNYTRWGTNCPIGPHPPPKNGFTPLPGIEPDTGKTRTIEPDQVVPIEDRVLDILRDRPDLRPNQPYKPIPGVPPAPGNKQKERSPAWATAIKTLMTLAVGSGLIYAASTASRMERLNAFNMQQGIIPQPRRAKAWYAARDLSERLGNIRQTGTAYKLRRKDDQTTLRRGTPWPFDFDFMPGFYYILVREAAGDHHWLYEYIQTEQELADRWQTEAPGEYGQHDPRDGSGIGEHPRGHSTEQEDNPRSKDDEEIQSPFNG